MPRTACPSCGELVGWKAVWAGLRCPRCRARLRLGYPALLLVAAAVAVAALAVITLLIPPALPGPDLPPGPGPAVLAQVRPEATVQALDGRAVRFGDLQGKVVFVNVWATWCPPCVAEMPSIERLYDALKGEGVEFVIVSAEPAERVREFVGRKGWHIPVYVFAGAPPAALASNAIPATFVLNPKGEVVFQHVGAANWDTEESKRFLRGLR